jgi:hypothetical protein
LVATGLWPMRDYSRDAFLKDVQQLPVTDLKPEGGSI